MAGAASDLQERLGTSHDCDQLSSSALKPLLHEMGKFACVKVITDRRKYHCAGSVIQVQTIPALRLKRMPGDFSFATDVASP
jgi:hypothetical protein